MGPWRYESRFAVAAVVARSGRDLPPTFHRSMSTISDSTASGDGEGEEQKRAWTASSMGSRNRHPRAARTRRRASSWAVNDAPGPSSAAAAAIVAGDQSVRRRRVRDGESGFGAPSFGGLGEQITCRKTDF
jgi:hypothetical protein